MQASSSSSWLPAQALASLDFEEEERTRDLRWILAAADPTEPKPGSTSHEVPASASSPGFGGFFPPIPEDHLFPTYDPDPHPEAPVRGWSSFLPIWGEALREEGFDLPLPFGFSTNYVHVERDIKVRDLSLGVNGGPNQSVSNLLQIDANSAVDVVIGRFDVWLLPFLNVYAYGGYQRNDSAVEIAVSIPTPGPGPPLAFTVRDDGELEGPVYGTGFAVAGGYDVFFATATVDFAFADFDEFDSRFEGRVYGFRAGWNGELFEIPTRIWSGFSYFDTETKLDGSVNVPGVGNVRFEVDQGPVHPWNGVLGLGIALPYSIDVMAEYGFNFDDVQIFTGGITIRL